MKLGILGTGKIVHDFLMIAHELPDLTMSVLGTEATREETEALAAEHHFERTFYDYEEMLASDVDTIYVALPNVLHYAFTKRALLAGKDVILEKPAVTRASEMRELAALAKERKQILIEAVTTHYLPAYQVLKEKIAEVGRVRIVSANYSQYSSRYDRFKQGIVLPAFDPQKAGGALMDLNVYNINFVVGLFGKPQAVHYHANIERDIDTSGILTLDYGDFKAVCIGAKDCGAPVMTVIEGDAGNFVVNRPVNQMNAFTINGNDGSHAAFEGMQENAHRMKPEFLEFIRMIRERDYEKDEAMLAISVTVAEILEEARHQAGLVFPGDEER